MQEKTLAMAAGVALAENWETEGGGRGGGNALPLPAGGCRATCIDPGRFLGSFGISEEMNLAFARDIKGAEPDKSRKKKRKQLVGGFGFCFWKQRLEKCG